MTNSNLLVSLLASFSSTRSKQKSTAIAVLFCLERCLPLRASDVAFGSDVHCVSDVLPYGEVGKHNITATGGSNITLYKRLKLCYNVFESEVLLWLNPNYANCQWIFPLILYILKNIHKCDTTCLKRLEVCLR